LTNCIQAAFSSGGGGGATVEIAERSQAASFSTSSTTATDITSFLVTKPDITDGKCFTFATFTGLNDNTGVSNTYFLDDNGSNVAVGMVQEDAGSQGYATQNVSLVDLSDSDGETAKVRMLVSSGTGYCYFNSSYSIPKLVAFGVG